jgi:imidazolonepropionase-like amidohydrolase
MDKVLFPVMILMTVFFIAILGAARTTRAGSQGPQTAPYRPEKPIVLKGGLLIDATGAAPKWDQAIVIEGERIRWVGPMEEVQIPEGAEVLDATGMTILPGLINSNCHMNLNPLYGSPTADLPLDVLKARWEANWKTMPFKAFVYLMQGVTSIRNTSGPFKQIIPVKHAIERGEIPGPRVFLGGALLMSDEHFKYYTTVEYQTPAETLDWVRNEFAYHVITDVDKDTDVLLSDDFDYWKLYMSGEPYDGKNDFTDEELRFMIDKAHENGKTVDVHCGASNEGLRRMLAHDIDTLEHPFYGHFLIDWDIAEGYAKKGVFADSLLTVMVVGAQHAAEPHRLNETLYAMTLGPENYPILLGYRDQMIARLRNPDEKIGFWGSFHEQQKQRETSRENMRRFIKAGVKMFMGTDTPSFLNFQQEDPDANEMRYMVELGMTPMEAILAATRNGAEAMGKLDDLGTLETGKLADVIVVPGNPILDMNVMKRVTYVIKGGVRYK